MRSCNSWEAESTTARSTHFFPRSAPPTLGPCEESSRIAEAKVTPAPDQTVSPLRDMFYKARSASNWPAAKQFLEQLKLRLPGDSFILQQLALATYKSKQPDANTALEEARTILSELHPETSNDPETLGMWVPSTSGCGN